MPGVIKFWRLAAVALAVALSVSTAAAQEGAGALPGYALPRLPEVQRRAERPDLGSLRVLRFLTESDYPPFHFVGADGQLTGFDVELARALCRELKVACTIQPRRWDTLFDALDEGRGDAVIAAVAISPANRDRVDLSLAYYRTPARFVVRRRDRPSDATPAALAGRTIAVVAGGAHAAFLDAFFGSSRIVPVAEPDQARRALMVGEVDALFGDGVTLALWLNTEEGAACCAWLGGPFLESAYFGEGAGIAVKRGNRGLLRAIEHALHRLSETGVYADLFLKYFPVSFYDAGGR